MGRAISNRREPRSCLGWVFNHKLGSFTWKQHKCTACKRPLLKLKTRPRFRPVVWSLSMYEAILEPIGTGHLENFKQLSTYQFVLRAYPSGPICPLTPNDKAKLFIKSIWSEKNVFWWQHYKTISFLAKIR